MQSPTLEHTQGFQPSCDKLSFLMTSSAGLMVNDEGMEVSRLGTLSCSLSEFGAQIGKHHRVDTTANGNPLLWSAKIDLSRCAK